MTDLNNQNLMTSQTGEKMTKNGCTLKYREGEAIPPAIDLVTAQNVGNRKSVSFFISALNGSLKSELHLLGELLQYLHKRRVTAYAVIPVLKAGYGPEAIVRASGLVLWVDIQDAAPEAIVWLRVKCRKLIRQMAWNKGVKIGGGLWQNSLEEMVGRLQRGSVASQVKTFTRNVRKYFLAGTTLTNGIIHYRVNKRGVLESAEADFREEPTRLAFSKVTVPELETRQPECSKVGRKRSPGGGSGRSRRARPRRWGDLIDMCR